MNPARLAATPAAPPAVRASGGDGRGWRSVQRIGAGLAALVPAALLLAATGDAALALGFFGGLALLAAGALLLRGGGAAAAGGAASDDGLRWSVVRAALAHDDVAVAITDRAGRMVCANDLYALWFDGFPTPPGLPLAGGGADALKRAGQAAWRDGHGRAAELELAALRLSAEVRRAGEADDHLVWRFAAPANSDLAGDFARVIEGPGGQILGQAGVMAALVNPAGRLLAANQAFLVRALGGRTAAPATGPVAGRDVAKLLRLDGAGGLSFASESGENGSGGSPLRLVQVPLAAADPAAPVALFLLDEDHAPAPASGNLSVVENLLATMPLGLGLVDRDGRFIYVNRAFGQATGTGDGKRPRYPGDMVVAEDKSALGDAVRRHVGGPAATSDMSVRLAGQPDEPVALRIAGVRGLGDAAALVMLKDGSEEIRLKRQVAQASKMQAVGQLAGGVAHDFNNILTAILGSCDLMLLRHSGGDGDYDDIKHIRDNANRAAGLTRQLLAFSRQQTLRPQILQLPDVVSEVSHLIKRLLGGQITLTVHHQRGQGPVRADPGQLDQVIMNLAVNANDAMPSGGTLTIETFAVAASEVAAIGGGVMPPGEYSAIRVADSGVGIAPATLSKIFEPFFTTKEVGKGTGLGLSTVYGIVKQSAGFIFADSELGKGTVFTIYLPVYRGAADGPALARPAKAKPKAPAWGTGKILLVEDEDVVRVVAERALIRCGYQVVCAANGEEGLERLASEAGVDLIVSDVVMPVMDGPAMVRAVRADHPTLPVVFMSGYAEETLRESIDLANMGFLPKPFSVEQLSNVVADALASARAAAADG